MIKYNLHRISLILLALALAFASCENKVEIVDQDLSYQLDPDFVFVDIPESFNFDPTNILFLSGQTYITLNASSDGNTTQILQGKSIPLNLRLKRAVDNDIVVNIVEDPELLNSYPGNKDNFVSLPEGSYSIPELVIPAGSKGISTFITFDNPNEINLAPGYLLPLRLELNEMVDGVKVSTNLYTLFIKIEVQFARDNIDSSNQSFNGELFNSTITFQSNKTSGLQYLNDGNVGGSYWYPSGTTIYLNMNMQAAETITGMRLHSTSGNYQLGAFDVFVEEEGRGYVFHGRFLTTERTTSLNVKFKKPVHTKSIRLEKFNTVTGGSQPDVTEIYLIK